MSWNITLGYVSNSSLQDFAAAGFGQRGDRTELGDIAFSDYGESIWAWETNGGVMLITRMFFPPTMLPSLSKGRTATQTILAGVSDIYQFEVYQDGESIRMRVVTDGEIAEESGTPLPAETESDMTEIDDAEDAHFALFSRQTGADALAWMEEPFVELEVDLGL